MTLSSFDPETEKNVQSWLDGHYDQKVKEEIKHLIETDPQAVTDAFYTKLRFGTAGLRGLMGVGCNRMNLYTVQFATQGLTNYLKTQAPPQKEHAVIIGYDCRHNSREFAEEAAKVLAGNGLRVYLFQELRPTPLVSFGCRLKECSAAIMVTASHNPKEYNGYKVYWNDGGQILPPHDRRIIEEVDKISDPSQVSLAKELSHPLIEIIDKEIDEAYLEQTAALQLYPKENRERGDQIKLAFSSLHGTGITLVPDLLKRWGFSNVAYVEEQSVPDGNFPTVHSPNPEEKSALSLGMKLMETETCDLLLATDPDADRIGVVVSHKREQVILNGNQIAILCLHHICEAHKEQGTMPPKAACVKSTVTTELFQAICDHYQVRCFNVLTGFKYIAEKIRTWEAEDSWHFLFGAEESYGCLMGTLARDKDAVLATALLAEMALQTKQRGKTLLDLLHEIYQKCGLFYEQVNTLLFEETKQGKKEMSGTMEKMRLSPPDKIGGYKVHILEDYLSSTHQNLEENSSTPLTLPQTNMLIFWLEEGSKVVVRPSGTEPKIKLYCGVSQKKYSDVEKGLTACKQKASLLLDDLTRSLTVSNG